MATRIALSIIIVNWNSAQYVRRCVESIKRCSMGLVCEIIIIDNATYDGYEQVRDEHPEVICVQSPKNLGFAKANNLAFQSSQGETLLFLNPDTEIVGSAILQLYRALHEAPDAGVVGSTLLNGDGTLQTSCIQAFPTLCNQVLASNFLQRVMPKSKLWGMEALHESTATVNQVECISGACMMIRREVFEAIGRFSEEYFMYTEDLDLCYKAHKAGWKNYYVPAARVVHFGGGSSKQAVSNFSAVMMRESVGRFLRKTRGGAYGFFYRCSMLLSAIGRLSLLAVFYPFQILRGQNVEWSNAFRKWSAILMWSLRGTRLVAVN